MIPAIRFFVRTDRASRIPLVIDACTMNSTVASDDIRGKLVRA